VIFGRICQQRGTYLRSIEPVPTNVRRLRDNLAINNLDAENVRIEEVALAETDGWAEMVICDPGKPGNAKIVGAGDYRVPVTSVDSLWNSRDRESIGFMKIDVEGWDVMVVEGGREAIRVCRPNMLIEFNRERMSNNDLALAPCWDFLTRELGYRVLRLDNRNRLVTVRDPGAHENLLFLT